MNGPIRFALCAAMFGCLGILGFEGSPAIGSPLNLTQQFPDLTAGFLTVDYVASAGSVGTFTATGWPAAFNITGSTNSIYTVDPDAYQLTAQINKATGAPISGSLDITGSIAALGATSGTLLTGTLSQFGYPSSTNGTGAIFEFMFNVTGGDLAPYYQQHGQVGVILATTHSGFNGSFATSFVNAISPESSDNFGHNLVPEPTSGFLLLNALSLGLLTVLCRRRRSMGA